MARTGNYTAFYVSEPFNHSNLKQHSAKDFVYYNLLKAWKTKDPNFPFNDSHDKTYNVRDNSDWENTLKPRLHDRLSKSKNIILFLSGCTKNSRALREEIEYGVNTKELPIIIAYPDIKTMDALVEDNRRELKKQIKDLWDKLPSLKKAMNLVPILNIPFENDSIRRALENVHLMVNTKTDVGIYILKTNTTDELIKLDPF